LTRVLENFTVKTEVKRMIDLDLLYPIFDNKDKFITFLKKCPIFKKLEEDKLDLIFEKAEIKKIRSGDLLCDYTKKIGSIFVLIHGRLRCLSEKEKNISFELIPKQSIGDKEVLTNRSKPIRIEAIRDSILLEISVNDFFSLLQISSQILENTCHIIAEKLHKNYVPQAKENFTKTIACISADEYIDNHKFAIKLKESLNSSGKTLIITSKMVKDLNLQEEAHLNEYLEKTEINYRYVLLVCDRAINSWTKFCLRQVDRILLLISTKRDSELTKEEKFVLFNEKILAQKDLIFTYTNDSIPTKSHLFLEKRKNFFHYHVNINSSLDMQKIARIATKRAIGLVLSGGGAKGIAQIGILRVLIEENIPIDFIGGTSIGSVIAALYAIGYRSEKLLSHGEYIFFKKGGIMDLTLPLYAFSKSKKIQKKLLYYTDVEIENLKTTYYCVSCNLTEKKQHIHKKGRLRDAIRSSIAIPGIFPVFWKNKKIFVDGGLLNIFPIDIMANNPDVKQIIAIDTSSSATEQLLLKPELLNKSGLHLLKEKLFHKRNNIPSIFTLLARSTDMRGSTKKKELINANIADIYIRPPIEEIKTLDFFQYKRIEEIGYRFAKKNITSWKEKLEI
jgi:predicted acylesterase/phospholipase RssA